MLFRYTGTAPDAEPQDSVAILESMDPKDETAEIRISTWLLSSHFEGGIFAEDQVFAVAIRPMTAEFVPIDEG